MGRSCYVWFCFLFCAYKQDVCTDRHQCTQLGLRWPPRTLMKVISIAEKAKIAFADPATTLNFRSEIMNKCPHRRKHLLENWTWGFQSFPLFFIERKVSKDFLRKNNKQKIMQNNYNCNCYLVFLMFCSVTLGMSLMIVVKTWNMMYDKKVWSWFLLNLVVYVYKNYL